METAPLPVYERIAIALMACLIHALGWTLREREIGRLEWSLRASRENAMWSLWHETLALGVWFYRRRRIHVMISTRRDGERIAQVTQRLGYAPVRGSTSKGALAATRRLVAALRGCRGARSSRSASACSAAGASTAGTAS